MSVSLITQSSLGAVDLLHRAGEGGPGAAREHLERAFAAEIARREVDSVQVQPGMATVAVVGLGMAGTPGIAARVFSALAAADINLVAIAQGSLRAEHLVRGRGQRGRRRPAGHPPGLPAGQDRRRARATHAEPAGRGDAGLRRRLAGRWSGLLARRKPGRKEPARAGGGGDRPQRLRVRPPRPERPAPGRAVHRGRSRARPFATAPGGQPATAAEAVGLLRPPRPGPAGAGRRHRRRDRAGAGWPALKAGMDLVLANKRPLSGPKAERDALLALAEAHGRRVCSRPPWAPGLPVLDTYRKLVESGDKVLKIEGCVSGTLGFLFTELGRGRKFSEAVRAAMDKAVHRARPARRPVGGRRGPQGADPGPPARLRGRARRRGDREPGARGRPRPDPGRVRGRAAEPGTASGRSGWTPPGPSSEVLRYVATVTRSRIRWACRASTAPARSPRSRGPTTRSPSPPPATAARW